MTYWSIVDVLENPERVALGDWVEYIGDVDSPFVHNAVIRILRVAREQIERLRKEG